MKNQKRVFRAFQYREADVFAAFLHEQSMKGWHFKKWKFGLVFEKGEPADIRYAVEVFPKGKEGDLRPEEDALDYAAYCEAAGWEFLDGARKFCIFRQKRGDAVPIVTEEERLQNIYQAERRRWLGEMGISCLLLLNVGMQVCTTGLQNVVFSNWQIGLLVFVLWIALLKLTEGLDLMLWRQKSKRSKDGRGSSLFYRENGEQRLFWRVFQKFEWWCGVLFLGVILFAKGTQGLIPAVLLCVSLSVVMALLLNYFRPDRDASILIQVGVGLLCLIVCIVGAILNVYNDKADVETQPPLVQADYRDMEGEPMEVERCEYYESIFGKMLQMKICYGEEPEYDMITTVEEGMTSVWRELKEGSKEQDVLNYTYRECYVDWLPEIVWERVIRDWGSAVDCTEDWGAAEAKKVGKIYFVWRENRILVLSSDVELNQEQIQKIREKLDL